MAPIKIESVQTYTEPYPIEEARPQDKSSSWLTTAKESAIGVGNLFSTAASSFLPRAVTAPIHLVLAGSARALGGIVTAATSGYDIYQVYRSEKAEHSESYPRTRREVVVSASSIAAGFGVGSIAGLATAGVAAIGAPAVIVGGVAVAGVVGVGYAAYKARDWVGGWYDNTF